MNERDDYDSPWKEILENYFPEFMRFFFPEAADAVDWKKGYRFLDKELEQIARDAELGKRYADKLVEVWRTNGEPAWVLVHVEIQGKKDAAFAKRMYVYNYRIFDRYDQPVASMAVLADDRADWRPDCFTYQFFGCRTGIWYPVVKLLDYVDQWDALKTNDNPFAIAIMAHVKTRETRQDVSRRQAWKIELTKCLYEKGYERQDVINLFRFIDWIMRLPEELETGFLKEMEKYEEDRKMPYITSVERIGMKKGMQRGMELSLKETIRKMFKKGMTPNQIAEILEMDIQKVEEYLKPA